MLLLCNIWNYPLLGSRQNQFFLKEQGWEGGCSNTIVFPLVLHCLFSFCWLHCLSELAFSPKVIWPISVCIPEFSRRSPHFCLMLILDWSLRFISIHLSSSFMSVMCWHITVCVSPGHANLGVMKGSTNSVTKWHFSCCRYLVGRQFQSTRGECL